MEAISPTSMFWRVEASVVMEAIRERNKGREYKAWEGDTMTNQGEGMTTSMTKSGEEKDPESTMSNLRGGKWLS